MQTLAKHTQERQRQLESHIKKNSIMIQKAKAKQRQMFGAVSNHFHELTTSKIPFSQMLLCFNTKALPFAL